MFEMSSFENNNSRKKVFIKYFLAGTILATLLGGCDGETPQQTLKTVSPTDTPTLNPTSSPTVEPTLTVAATSEPTPTSTEEVSTKICDMMDDVSISDHQLRHEITADYIKVDEGYGIILCMTGPDGELSDFFTTKVTFNEKDGKYIPTKVIKELGEIEHLASYSLKLYMTQILKISDEKAEEELSKIKSGNDLKEWYERMVPKDQQVVIPWEDLVGLKENNYDEKLITWLDNTLDTYRQSNPEIHNVRVKELVV